MFAGSVRRWRPLATPVVLTRTLLPGRMTRVEVGVPALPVGYVAACAAWSLPDADELRVRAWLLARFSGGW